jgi:hypothetical protein
VIRSHVLYPFGYSRLSVHSMISAMIMAIVHRLPDTPMTASYGASVTKKLRIWLISIFVALAVPLVGVIGVAYMINGEEICLDRHPWWGPPEDPTSTCAGHFYESTHHVPFPQR